MKSEPISSYIYFGTCVRFLQDAEPEWKVFGDGYVLDNINTFFNKLDEFNLPVTTRVAYELSKFQKELLKSNSEENDGNNENNERRLNEEEALKLRHIMSDIRRTLDAEANGNLAYIVKDKRIDVNKLLLDIPGLMSPNVFASLSEIAQYDFKEAGKCIAFELPTAAAFHLLRGTEAALKDYYCHIIKRKRVKIMMWGPMVKHLKQRKSKPIPPASLLNKLDDIRFTYRNPTQHPEKIYDIHEVQDLFGLCIDVVNRMKYKLNK